MGFSGIGRLLTVLVVAIAGIGAPRTMAQDGAQPTVVASGLTSPRGFLWAGSETMLVAMAGSGGATGMIASVSNASCPSPLSSGLPSAVDSAGHITGAGDLAVLDGQLYVAIGGSLAGDPGGISIVYGDGSTAQVADLSPWSRPDLASALPERLAPFAGYSMVADPDAGVLWVSDPASQQILAVTIDGTVTRIADFAPAGLLPTRLALHPDGGVYAGALDPTSLEAGTARVVHIDSAGTISDVWTDRTAVSDVAVGLDGALYALEMTLGEDPESGRLVRQGESAEEVVATGLALPAAMEIGPDGAFYISGPVAGAASGEGEIVRVAPDGSVPAFEASAECAPLPETLATGEPEGGGGNVPAQPEATQVPTPTAGATEAPAPTAVPPVAGSPAPVMAEVQIAIADLTFQPVTIQITAGTTIRWTNLDDTGHTATGTAGAFDTGVISPGGSAIVTLQVPGTYTYFCQLHPEMQATIIVT